MQPKTLNIRIITETGGFTVAWFVSRGGTREFKWRGWSNGAKSQDPKKSLGLPTKPKKIPGPKIRSLADWGRNKCSSDPHIWNSQVTSKRNQKFTKAKEDSSDGKANWLNWSGRRLVDGRVPQDNGDVRCKATPSLTIKQQQNTFVCTLFAELRSQGTTDSF